MKNFFEILEFNAKNFGSKVALFFNKDKITYKELYTRVCKLRNFLLLTNIKQNDRIGILLKNSPEFIEIFLAIGSIGGVPVPINIFFKNDEIDYILKDANIKFLFSSSEFKKVIPNFADTIYTDSNEFDLISSVSENFKRFSFESLGVIVYTSGTSSNPKGVMLTYENLLSNLSMCQDAFKLSKNDRFIVYLPMFHSFTLTVGVLFPLYLGASSVIIKSIFPFSNIIKEILLKRVSIFLGIPAVYSALIKAKLPWYFKMFNNLKYFICGSAPLAKITIDEFNKTFPKALLSEGYGLSECSPVVSVNTKEFNRSGSVGKPLNGVEVKIVDENLLELPIGSVGEVIIKGANVMKGYLNKEEITDLTIVNSWLRTGDLGKVDEDGYLYIVDRLKDLIISKGINIYPREIEEVINLIKGVKNSAVIGIKNEELDEEVIAFIVPEDNAVLDKKEIFKFLKSKLANYKIPKSIYICKDLPTNATGKILKRELKANIKDYENG